MVLCIRCEAYGEKHLQTVKAITMIALLERKLGREEAGIEWYRKELRIREELQARSIHARTYPLTLSLIISLHRSFYPLTRTALTRTI